jgi:diguanylate cyclase (GGDEF)-like protein
MLNITHKMIIDHMKVPVVLFDYEGIVADFNVAMSKIFDDLKYDAREQTIDWFIKKKNCPDLRKKETFTWKINDDIFDCRVHYLKSNNNRMLGMILVMQDITELTKAYDDLEKSITFDALTGIYNKYSFYKKNKDSNYNRVVVCNIENLTYINEKFGQAAGDNILIGLANILVEKTKKTDFVARLDDGDFAILLNGSEIKVIEQMTEIKEIIRKRLSTKNIYVNIEFGICEIADMADLEKCVNLARESMVNKKMLSTTSKRSSLLGSLKQGLNEYDMQTDKQIERERELCEKFADFIGLNDTVKAQLSMLAALHDIGKVAIPNSILMKTSKLDEDERELMKTHTEKGYRIAKAASELEPIAFSILSHHERFDGMGYPNGLMGEDIPLLARMFSIVDAYDAMTHDRPYRKAMSKEDAIEEIIKCKGTQFDPKLADEFIKLIRKRG